jgi:hypothetical protein
MKQKIKNLALITFSGEGMSIAKHFKDDIGDEGKVIVGIIEDQADIYTQEELKKMKGEGKDPSDEGEDGKTKKLRLSGYEGILDTYSADSVVEFLKKQEDKESWFVFCDMNYCFKYATMLSEFMPHGIFPTEEQRAMESDRERAKEFIHENYPDVAKERVWECKTVDEGMKLIESAGELLVLKGNNPDAPTIVPPTDDIETSNEILLNALEENKELYNAGGMIFEAKLTDAIELTPERCYYNGEEIFTSLDIETKRKYAGDVGSELVGCGTDIVLMTDMDDKINKVAFPPIVDELAQKAKGMFYWDLSLLISKASGKMYPGEFCANRVGWDSFPSEMDGVSPVDFFTDIVNYRNPLEGKKASCSVRVFSDEKDGGNCLGGVKIIFPEDIEKCVWPYDAKMENGELVTVGYDPSVAVITSSGSDFASAVNTLYDYASKFALATKRWGYRSKGDFLDDSYCSSLVTRYNYAVDKGLITGYQPYVREGNDDRVQELHRSYGKKIKDMETSHSNDMKGLRDEITAILHGD